MDLEEFYKNNKWKLWISSIPFLLVLVLIITMYVFDPGFISIPLFLLFAWLSSPFSPILTIFGMIGAKGFPTFGGFFLVAVIYSFLLYVISVLVDKLKKKYFS